MPSVVSSRRPSHRPASTATHHQTAATYTSVFVSARVAPDDGDDGEHRRGPAVDQHGHPQEVAEPHEASSSASTCCMPAMPSTTRPRLLDDLGAGPRRSARPRSRRRPARRTRPARPERANASRSVTSSPAYSATPTGDPLQELADGAVLADRHRRPDLQHLAAPVRPQALRHRLGGDPLARARGRPPRRARRASGSSRSGPCPRSARAARAARACRARARTRGPPGRKRAKSGMTRASLPLGLEQLGAVQARSRRCRPRPTSLRTSAAARPEMHATRA